jgi:hypothetical protein
MRNPILIALCGLLVGCATDMTVRMQRHPYDSVNESVLVVVKDMRAPGIAASKREAAFGVPMGNLTFDPPEGQMVKNVLEDELTKLAVKKGIRTEKEFSCEIIEFGVNTITSPLYWDVIGRVRLVLRQNGEEYGLLGTHTERTYVWPGEAVVKKTVEESLNQIIVQLMQVAME